MPEIPLLSEPPAGGIVPTVSPRTVRLVELGLLLAVAFGTSLYTSVASLLGLTMSSGSYSNRWLPALIHELTALALCAYLLHKQGRSFRNLGLTFRWFDPLLGVGIMVLGLLASFLVNRLLTFAGYFSPAEHAAHAATITRVIGTTVPVGMFVFTVVNGFYEELIARAYLMTDVSSLTGNTALAVVISAVFQGAYHLYQGWQVALGVTTAFAVFSLFYVRTRRLTPIVLAHVFWDLLMLIGYIYRGAPQAD